MSPLLNSTIGISPIIYSCREIPNLYHPGSSTQPVNLYPDDESIVPLLTKMILSPCFIFEMYIYIASLVAQMVKNLPAMQKTWVRSLGREDSREEGMTTYSSILAWRIPWIEKPGGLPDHGVTKRHDRVTKCSIYIYIYTHTHTLDIMIWDLFFTQTTLLRFMDVCMFQHAFVIHSLTLLFNFSL